MMKKLLAVCAMFLALGAIRAEEKKETKPAEKAGAVKIDAEKLVGKWKITDAGDTEVKGAILEFTKDGKMSLIVEAKGMKFDLSGTYKVDGDKIKMKLSFGGKDKEDDLVVTKFTEKVVEFVDPDKKKATMEKVK